MIGWLIFLGGLLIGYMLGAILSIWSVYKKEFKKDDSL